MLIISQRSSLDKLRNESQLLNPVSMIFLQKHYANASCVKTFLSARRIESGIIGSNSTFTNPIIMQFSECVRQNDEHIGNRCEPSRFELQGDWLRVDRKQQSRSDQLQNLRFQCRSPQSCHDYLLRLALAKPTGGNRI
jgi:hypothetical protein